MGVPAFISHFTTQPLYFIKIPLFTTIAYITGQTFVIRQPRYLPRFIGRPSSQKLRTFLPTPEEISYICSRSRVGAGLFAPHRWKPTEDVFIELEELSSTHPSPIESSQEIDFSTYRLVGPRLVQGQGIIGHGVCYVLIEELGQ